MTDTIQKLREALQAYQDANEMSPYGDYSKIEWESSAGPVNPSWGGGDCKKHGRWYGRCYSCSDEWDNLRKMADRDAYTVRENALNAAKQMARQALALPTADHLPAQEVQSDPNGWCEYVAGMVFGWLQMTKELPEEDRSVAAIAGIIRRRLWAYKPAQDVGLTDEQKTWAVNQLMEQAQVFASAWSLVGGRHDFGNALEEAEQAKTELRSMVVEALRAKGAGHA